MKQGLFDYFKANYTDLCNFLLGIDFSVCELLPNVDSVWDYIKDMGMHIFIMGMHMFIAIYQKLSYLFPNPQNGTHPIYVTN